MSNARAIKLAARWNTAVSKKWHIVREMCRVEGVPAPKLQNTFEDAGIVAVLDATGFYLRRRNGSNCIGLDTLLGDPEFPVKFLMEIIEWVRGALKLGADLAKEAADRRETLLNEVIKAIETDIAEWNLSSKQGDDV